MKKGQTDKEVAPTILVIEDDADTREILARLLAKEGYRVRLAANAWDGLAELETPPHLIILDMMLPGMDGILFLRTLRGQRTYQHLPVIVFTGADVHEIAPKVRPLGVEHVIGKGDAVFPKLKAAMRSLLNQPRPHARAELPEPGNVVRPCLNAYLKMLQWS